MSIPTFQHFRKWERVHSWCSWSSLPARSERGGERGGQDRAVPFGLVICGTIFNKTWYNWDFTAGNESHLVSPSSFASSYKWTYSSHAGHIERIACDDKSEGKAMTLKPLQNPITMLKSKRLLRFAHSRSVLIPTGITKPHLWELLSQATAGSGWRTILAKLKVHGSDYAHHV